MIKQHKSLMEIAYTFISQKIYFDEYKQGDVLNEGLIAEELHISRTPVREAMKILAANNIVEIKNGVGAIVRVVTFKEIRDIYELRGLLELCAVKTAIYNISESDIENLREKFNFLLEKHRAGKFITVQEFIIIDWKLHELIINRCENKYVKSMCKGINFQCQRIQLLSAESLNDIEESTNQHLRILDLLQVKDIKSVGKELRRHFKWSIKCFENR